MYVPKQPHQPYVVDKGKTVILDDDANKHLLSNEDVSSIHNSLNSNAKSDVVPEGVLQSKTYILQEIPIDDQADND